MDKHKKAKPTAADTEAAQRLKAIWRAMPRDQRPTQDELAARYGQHGDGGTQSTISQYMNGVIPLNIRAVLFFARELGCRPEDIYPGLPGLDQVVAIASNTPVIQQEPTTTLEEAAHRREASSPASRAADEKWASFSLEQKQRILELVEIAGLIVRPSAAPKTRQHAEADVVRHSDTASELRRQRKARHGGRQKQTIR